MMDGSLSNDWEMTVRDCGGGFHSLVSSLDPDVAAGVDTTKASIDRLVVTIVAATRYRRGVIESIRMVRRKLCCTDRGGVK